jgi:hypothetical protein
VYSQRRSLNANSLWRIEIPQCSDLLRRRMAAFTSEQRGAIVALPGALTAIFALFP